MMALNRITCEDAFRRLDDYLDIELSAREMALVRNHLETCEACAHEFAFEESVLRGVREKLRHVRVPSDLQSRVLEALHAAAWSAGGNGSA